MTHYYDLQTGEPVWSVPNKTKPGTRKPNIRDARKRNLGVGVTTIIGFEAAPGLERWKVNEAVKEALAHPDLDALVAEKGVEGAMHHIRKASQEQVKDAADHGKWIHDLLERALAQGIRSLNPDDRLVIGEAYDAVVALLDGEKCKLEQNVVAPVGYGGRIDCHSDSWLLDFKTKDFTPEDVEAGKVKAWNNHRLQLVAYDMALRTMGSDEQPEYTFWRKHANVFISRNPDHLGLTHVVTHETTDSDKWLDWSHFYHLLRAFQAAKRLPQTGPRWSDLV